MNLCNANKILAKEVKDFMLHVKDVNEESITDFLIWKWKEIDKKFKAIDVSTFTRHQESTLSGADYEMEIWIVGNKYNYPLVFQAKKFRKQYDSYVRKLRYPSNTKKQMNTLLKYAKTHNKIPFYMYYSLPDENTTAMCQGGYINDCAVFMSHAKVVEEFADKIHGNRISKNDLLAKSNPFHCIFCCPLAATNEYFTNYFQEIKESSSRQELPAYAQYLLNVDMDKINSEEMKYFIEKNELNIYRYVAVYDMRDMDETSNKTLERNS